MSSMFDQLAEELFQVLKGYGKVLTLFDGNGTRVYNPSAARRSFAEPDKMMLTIDEDGSNSSVGLFLSNNTNTSTFRKLINTLRHLSTRYNVLFNVRKYNRELSPKDFAYASLPISESVEITEELDASYYMEEGCGIFALALAKVIPGGKIGIIVNRRGEKYSSSIPYEVTHVFYDYHNQTYDVKGSRSLREMANDFHIVDYYTIDDLQPNDFAKKYVGNSDSKPLYGSKSDIKEAISFIKQSPEKYGLITSPNVEETIFEALTGSIKTSYQRFGTSRLIIKHSARVDETKRGSRSRNIRALFVENNKGERFRFPVVHLSGSRAWAQHINQCGSPYNQIGEWIVNKAVESTNFSKINKHIKHNRLSINEEISNLQSLIRQRIFEIRCQFNKLSRQRVYPVESLKLDFNRQLDENQTKTETSRLGILLGIEGDHPLQESLQPLVQLTKGEKMATNTSKFHRVVALENADDLVEALTTEYGYKQGTAWNRNNKNIAFLVPEAFDAAKSYLDLSGTKHRVIEAPFDGGDSTSPVTDKFLAYAQKWLKAQSGGEHLGHVGDDWSPKDLKAVSGKANELSTGLKQLLSGRLDVNPVPAPAMKTSNPQAAAAVKIGQLLAPQAGLQNDMLHNYLSALHDKLGAGERLTGVEQQVASKCSDLVDSMANNVGESSTHFNEDGPDSPGDKFVAYAQKWLKAQSGGEHLGHVGDDWSPKDLKAVSGKADQLAAGLKQLLAGRLDVHPVPAPPMKTSNPSAAAAIKVGQLLAPQAGLQNDMLHNYLSALHDKLGAGEPLSPVEKQIAAKCGELVDSMSNDVEEDIWNEDDNVDASFQEGDHVSTPMGPGKVTSCDGDWYHVELQHGKNKTFKASELEDANPGKEGMGVMKEVADIDEWFDKFDPFKFLNEQPEHINEFDAKTPGAFDYTLDVAGQSDVPVKIYYGHSEEEPNDIHSVVVSATGEDVLDQLDPSQLGQLQDAVADHEESFTNDYQPDSDDKIEDLDRLDDSKVDEDSDSEIRPRHYKVDSEKAFDHAIENFDLSEFFEHYGQDFNWSESADDDVAPEDLHYDTSYVINEIAHYLMGLSEKYDAYDSANLDESEFQHEAEGFFNHQVKPAMEARGYTFTNTHDVKVESENTGGEKSEKQKKLEATIKRYEDAAAFAEGTPDKLEFETQYKNGEYVIFEKNTKIIVGWAGSGGQALNVKDNWNKKKPSAFLEKIHASLDDFNYDLDKMTGKEDTDESVVVSDELPPAGFVLPGDAQHDFRNDVSSPHFKGGMTPTHPYASELARLRLLAGMK